MRIGLFGGSFDPPHLGHLILAELARDQLSLDQLWWVPAGEPPHKQDWQLTPVEHRVVMVRRCIEGNAFFQLSLIDVERKGPHFTVDLLRLVAQENRGAELYFLLGGDSLQDLPTWHEPNEVIRYAQLAVMKRPNTHYDLTDLEVKISNLTERVVFLDTPSIEISARDIRNRVSEGRSIRYLVSDNIRDYISLHSLYQHNED